VRSPSVTVGMVLAGVLGVLDLAVPLLSDGEHPPRGVALAVAAFGVATLVALVPAWRGNRPAGWIVVATRLLSAAGAAPAFVVDDVPTPALVAAVVVIGGSLLAVGLLVPWLVRGRALTADR
jgi:NAD/NADP transhydrogenase beta subunit